MLIFNIFFDFRLYISFEKRLIFENEPVLLVYYLFRGYKDAQQGASPHGEGVVEVGDNF